MHKELLPYWHIGSYSAFLLLGLVGGYLLTRWRAVRLGIKGSHIDNLVLLISLCSLFGARFFSWWLYFPPGSSFWDALIDSSAGMVFYGGFLFGFAAAILYSHLRRISLGNLMDALAPGLALGLALGRVGCFLAGCCWGDLCVAPGELGKLPSSDLVRQVRTIPAVSGADFPLAVRFPRDAGAYVQHHELGLVEMTANRSRPVHPVQLYESVLALALCLALHLGFNRRRWPGDVACAVAAGYGAIRFMTEFLRGDNGAAYLGLTLSQVISVLLAAIALGLLLHRRSRCLPDARIHSIPAGQI